MWSIQALSQTDIFFTTKLVILNDYAILRLGVVTVSKWPVSRLFGETCCLHLQCQSEQNDNASGMYLYTV